MNQYLGGGQIQTIVVTCNGTKTRETKNYGDHTEITKTTFKKK